MSRGGHTAKGWRSASNLGHCISTIRYMGTCWTSEPHLQYVHCFQDTGLVLLSCRSKQHILKFFHRVHIQIMSNSCLEKKSKCMPMVFNLSRSVITYQSVKILIYLSRQQTACCLSTVPPHYMLCCLLCWRPHRSHDSWPWWLQREDRKEESIFCLKQIVYDQSQSVKKQNKEPHHCFALLLKSPIKFNSGFFKLHGFVV